MSSDDIIKRLMNDEEFMNKLAEKVAEKIVITKLTNIEAQLASLNKKVDELIDYNKLVWERFEEESKKRDEEFRRRDEELVALRKQFEEESKKRHEEFWALQKKLEEESAKRHEEIMAMQKKLEEEFRRRDEELVALRKQFEEESKKRDEEFKKRDERFNAVIKRLDKQIRQLNNMIENLTGSLEQEAMDYLEYRFKQLGLDVSLSRFEVKGKFEVDIYGETGDYVIIGEVKARAGVSTLSQLMKVVKRLEDYKPEIRNKKKVLIIYSPSVTKQLIEECEKEGVYLTNGYKEFTQLKLPL
jgi:chromosome segregation ATPase